MPRSITIYTKKIELPPGEATKHEKEKPVYIRILTTCFDFRKENKLSGKEVYVLKKAIADEMAKGFFKR